MKLKTACFLLICILLSGCGYYNSMVATVVDAETMKPIEGAIINVNCFKNEGWPGLTYGRMSGRVEVVTDKDGKAYIERVCNPLVSEFTLAVYKPGYVVWGSRAICKPGNVNRWDMPNITKDMLPSCETRKDFRWEDYTFKLERFKPEYSHADHESLFNSAINSSFMSYYDPIQEAFRECEGEKVRAEGDRINKWRERREREEAEKRKK